MKDRLRKSGLRVIGVEIERGRLELSGLRENRGRRYPLYGGVLYTVITSQGMLHVQTAPGFVFDGRSGPRIVDWYVPNLGTFEEVLCWLTHDCNGYGKDLSFKDTNVLLYAMLRDLAHYRPSKCSVVQLAVGLSDSWYGEPEENDWCYANRSLVSTLWVPKVVV